MNCRRVVELLIDYVANEMPADERVLFERHLECCSPCLVYMETYSATIRLTRALPREAPLPPELEQRLLAVLREIDKHEG
jgi:anti-sigma factor RsiW